MNSVITSQPVISYQTEPSPVDIYKHKCLCEKCVTYPCKSNINADEDNYCCCENFDSWLKTFKTYDALRQKGDTECCCTILCCPIKFPFLFTFGLPCTLYNMSRNKCMGTKDKNYLC
jgi:hypothetical protein